MNTPNAQASPTPWRLIDHPTESARIEAANSVHVADVYCTDMPCGAANAALIVRAVNAHAALTAEVARLTEALQRIRSYESTSEHEHGELDPALVDVRKIARTALAENDEVGR